MTEFQRKHLPNVVITCSLYAFGVGLFIATPFIAVFHVLLFVAFGAGLLVHGRSSLPGLRELPLSFFWLGAFILIAVISTLLNWSGAAQPLRSLFKLKYALAGLAGAVVFRNHASHLFSPVRIQATLVFVILCLGVASAYGLAKLDVTSRASGLTGIMRYAHTTAVSLVALTAIYVNHGLPLTGIRDRAGVGAAYVLGSLGLYFSYTRGAWIGFLAAMPVAAFLHHRRHFVPSVLLAMVAIALIVRGQSAAEFVTGRNLEGYQRIGVTSDENSVCRIHLWKIAARAIQERPFFGFGVNQFRNQNIAIAKRHGLNGNYKTEGLHAHNLFIDLAANTGLLGVGCFVLFLLFWIREIMTESAGVRNCVVPTVCAFIVCGFTEYNLDAQNAAAIFLLYSVTAGSKMAGFQSGNLSRNENQLSPGVGNRNLALYIPDPQSVSEK